MAYRTLSVVVVSLMSISGALGQSPSRFADGYVLITAGDTLSGEVALAGSGEEVVSVAFRPRSEEETIVFGPDDILEFGLADGRRFVSRPLPGQGEHRAAFMQVLERGPMNLLVHLGRDDRYFIEADHFPLEQLRPTVRDFDAYEGVAELRRPFITTLVRALYPCPEVQQRADDVRYDERSFARIVREYNACMGAPSESSRVARRLVAHVTPRIGGGVAWLYNTPRGSSSPRAIPYAGLSVEVGFPRFLRGSTVMAEVSYMQKGIGDQDYFGRWAAPAPEDFERDYFGMQLGLRYQAARPGLAPYGSIGIFRSHIPGEVREVIAIPPYSPQVHDGGVFGEFGIAVPYRQLGDLVVGLRMERANAGTPRVLDFPPLAAWKFRNLSAVLVVGMRL